MTDWTRKCLAMVSGGLDSILAVRLMLDQGIEVVAVNFVTSFCAAAGTPDAAGDTTVGRIARELGIEHRIVDCSLRFLEVLRKPRHGYGSNLNPCIDCKIFFLSLAREMMPALGASFIVTGEVLGQRPMSQHRGALNTIERESGLTGRLLRPLCAAHLEPTPMELAGVVDRARLCNIHGRGRQPQLEMAAAYEMKKIPAPAGGCLLTDPLFADRLADRLLTDRAELTLADIEILKYGRQFRLGPDRRLVVGRDAANCEALEKIEGRVYARLELRDVPGPLGVLWGGPFDTDDEHWAARIVGRYSTQRGAASVIVVCRRADGTVREIEAAPASAEETDRWLLKVDPIKKKQLRVDNRN